MPSISFNPAGVHEKTVALHGKTRADGKHVLDYIVQGEILNGAQDNSKKIGAALLGVNPALGASILANPLPTHVGKEIPLPGNFDINGNTVPRWSGEKHSINAAISGIEAVKTRDQKTLQHAVTGS